MFVVLFGSVALGEATWKSDIDVLFVLEDASFEEGRAAILDELANIQDDLTHPVRAHAASRGGFLDGGTRIARAAAEEGIVIHAPEKEVELWRPMKRHKNIAL